MKSLTVFATLLLHFYCRHIIALYMCEKQTSVPPENFCVCQAVFDIVACSLRKCGHDCLFSSKYYEVSNVLNTEVLFFAKIGSLLY